MLTPEQRPTLTISESGVVLTETHDGNEVPADYSFAIVNDYVHAHGRHFEELQYLALGMASHIDALQARIAELEQDAANAAAAARERIKKICGDVIDEWFNCAGGADKVLRRIEEPEQNGETKP